MSRKIIQISPFSFDHPGGVEQYARSLQELFPNDMSTLSGGEDFPIIEIVRHFPVPAFWKQGFWNIFSSISKEDSSCIISHIRFAPTAWLAFFLAKKRWIPYIHIEHGTGFLIHNNPLIAWVSKIVDLTIGKYIIRHANQVICVSEAGKKWIEETFERKKNISVIYRGFEFPKITRKKNTIPKIGFVGRLTGLKNVAWLLDSLHRIQDKKWILEIVWTGEEWENLKRLTTKLWLDDRVTFLWVRSHDWIMAEFYPSVDVLINPSLQEWIPTTVIEALGMGCQVIATDVGGTREISKEILIKPNNQAELKIKIYNFIENKNQKLQINLEKFTLNLMKQSFQKVFTVWK